MDISGSQVAASQAKVQLAAATKIVKMNADSEKAVASLVEAASENLKNVVAATPPGTGGNLDVSV